MAETKLKVGAAKVLLEIPDTFFPHEGFHGIHDPLFVRSLLLDNEESRVMLVAVDLTSIGRELSDELRRMIAGEYDLDPAGIFICASHTFQAPHIKPDQHGMSVEDAEKNRVLREVLFRAVKRSAGRSVEGLRPGRMGFGRGCCDVNINRDVWTKHGWWKGPNPHGISDKTVTVIRFETEVGRPIAFFVNYAVQSSVLLDSVPSDGRVMVSADLGGAVSRYIEEQYDGEVVSVWNVGAAGDQDPVMMANRHHIDRRGEYFRNDIHDAGYALLEILGEQLGQEAVRVGEGITRYDTVVPIKVREMTVSLPGQKIFPNVHEMAPSKKYVYENAEPFEVPVSVLIINNLALIGVAPELVCRTALEIKARSPYRYTVVMTMVNGAAKYLPDTESYDRITYAAMNSRGGRGAAEVLREEIINLLNETVLSSA